MRALVFVFAFACGPSLSEAGRRVVVVEGPWTDVESSVSGSSCVDLGEVTTSASSSEVHDLNPKKSGSLGGKSADENALIELRNQIGDRGGTHFHVEGVKKDAARNRSEITGRAYRCASAS
jgi:hypothetical protein